ncbi:MAG TPA: hypothetical protein VK508_08645 [Cyclobacteriaceae bacterium]|nr:hypothetical protein [Cyclobacteriaceae bacterium]
MHKLRFIAFLILIIPTLGWSQNIQVRSRFLADTLKIGEKVPFAVTARYPRKVNILYPDSSYSFNPFELEGKEYFPTVTRDSISYDSAVYYLTSYEVDSIQMFRMPVYVLQGRDCTVVFGVTDSIVLKQLVNHVPDSVSAEKLPLKTDTRYLDVSWLFNYRLANYIIAALVVIGVVVWLVFGKRIKRYFILKRLNKAHVDFLHRFADAQHQLQGDFSTMKAETALVIWKRYMENLEERPFTKYSSKEILRLLEDKNLAPALRSIDRMVYGGISSNTEVFNELREVSRSHFNEKLRKVNNE